MKTANELLELLDLKSIDSVQFEGVSKTIGSPHVFGGQVLAQSVNAAYRTITNQRVLHSLHAYFLEAGDLNLPIVYDVNEVRDGGSFSTRRVLASQNGKAIFILAASFHKLESGYDHHIQMNADLKQPEELLSWTEMLSRYGSVLPKITKHFLEIERPIEFKPVEVVNPLKQENLPPYSNVWFKLKDPLQDSDLATKQQVLTYISDYNILAAALLPHASKAHFGNTQMASLDHSMWFFRDFDYDDWMLYSIETPNASNARGFAKGNIFSRDGKLIACVAQEGLMRPMVKK
ncbi:acyl-CoA thioesterase [Formosa algae]|jgi:acyl-CoA thioesterase-2|uniref:Acyl-CoA thioesterase 2 n=1 Tax=Formosa algae TaxID=225843 RepID=A0A9X0YLS6_9FLAO|nr:acyl-CoA thioesterase II [Formosa algae]MBP1839243.1 acyl-CoA thioesterase-2 [Formosa algae]MDQ0334020.1 acyl-CoA thioesterase-2 [Formosa algae]OEI79348.1 acyl-CoA thioesterase II [Formosa algae]PNW26969.1 acyl-CoA thioesterase II [Formosa algae]